MIRLAHGPVAAVLSLAPVALAAQAIDRTTAPTLGAPPTLTMPTVQRATLPNGVRLQVVTQRELPLVEAVLVIEGGALLDGERPGLASFTADLLDEGAGGRDALALAAQAEFFGAALRTTAGWDGFRISVGAPRRTFAPALALLADVALRPLFRADDVARVRGLRLAAILRQRDQPGTVASLVSDRLVFPVGHPYRRPIGGDSATIAALDSAAVRRFWEGAADPRRATLTIVGDITLADARRLAAEALGPWRAPTAALPRPALASYPTPPRPETRLVLVDKPGAPQSVVTIAAPGLPRGHPDYAAVTLLNTVLGGSFSSRLNDVLREQKGWTYGARSGFAWRPLPGAFSAGADIRADVTDSALAVFFAEFRRLREEPVPADELERARAYVVLGALGRFETNGQVAAQLTQLDAFGLPPASVPRELAAMQRLTAAAVQAAARRHLDPARLTVVVVGDVATLRPRLEALGLGPVSVTTIDGS